MTTICAAYLLCSMFAATGSEPLQALILSGQNNHAWQETTPVLRDILESNGRFAVEVLEQPDTMTLESLANVDVIVSNWNAWGDAAVKQWPESARNAFVEFVRKGGGYVSVHAGSSSFYDWNEYHELTIARWNLEKTGHGKQHAFRVTPSSETHPITDGIAPFETFDELWHRTGIVDQAIILMTAFSSEENGGSGSDEPVVLAKPFGEGRSVNILLGHHAQAMSHPSFAALFSRSAEWAATGAVTLPPRNIEWFEDAGALRLAMNGETLWQLNFGPEAAKPYFHPVRVVGGPELTWNAPEDHPWHHGLWFSWKFINGINFWEEDRTTGKSEGLTTWAPPTIEKHPDGSADITFNLEYRTAEGALLLSETRTHHVSPPKNDGSVVIEWASRFVADAPEVVLDRTPIEGEPDGKTWGGYAGLSVRLSNIDGATVHSETASVATDGGLVNLDARAIDYSGAVDGRSCGIAIVDLSGQPGPWYVITQPAVPFHYFSPALLYRAKRSLKQGEELSLRYGIYIHPEAWTDGRLREILDQDRGK